MLSEGAFRKTNNLQHPQTQPSLPGLHPWRADERRVTHRLGTCIRCMQVNTWHMLLIYASHQRAECRGRWLTCSLGRRTRTKLQSLHKVIRQLVRLGQSVRMFVCIESWGNSAGGAPCCELQCSSADLLYCSTDACVSGCVHGSETLTALSGHLAAVSTT